MKYFFTIVAFAAVVLIVKAQLTEEQIKKVKSHHDECIKESGVDSALIVNAKKGEFSDDSKLKDHLFCFAKKIGFMNDAGEIQKDVLLAKLGPVIKDEGAVQKLIDECAVQKSTPGETAFETVKCYYIKTPTHNSLL